MAAGPRPRRTRLHGGHGHRRPRPYGLHRAGRVNRPGPPPVPDRRPAPAIGRPASSTPRSRVPATPSFRRSPLKRSRRTTSRTTAAAPAPWRHPIVSEAITESHVTGLASAPLDCARISRTSRKQSPGSGPAECAICWKRIREPRRDMCQPGHGTWSLATPCGNCAGCPKSTADASGCRGTDLGGRGGSPGRDGSEVGTARDVDGLAGYPAALRAREEAHHVCDVLRLADPAEGGDGLESATASGTSA